MKKTELNNELLEKVNGGTTIDDILNPTPYDPTLPLFDPDHIPEKPGVDYTDINVIRKIMKDTNDNHIDIGTLQ